MMLSAMLGSYKYWYCKSLVDCVSISSSLVVGVLCPCNGISRWTPTCDSAHSLWLCGATPLGAYPASVTLCWKRVNQSMPYSNNAEHLTRKRKKYQFLIHWFNSTGVKICGVGIPRNAKMADRCSTHSAITSGREPVIRNNRCTKFQKSALILTS